MRSGKISLRKTSQRSRCLIFFKNMAQQGRCQARILIIYSFVIRHIELLGRVVVEKYICLIMSDINRYRIFIINYFFQFIRQFLRGSLCLPFYTRINLDFSFLISF